MAELKNTIGIDLGTSYSRVAVVHNGRTKKILNELGLDSTPNYVFVTAEGSFVMGQPAKDGALIAPERTIFELTRIIGRPFNDPTLKKAMKRWPFQVIGENNTPKIRVHGFYYNPEDLLAEIFKKLKSDAEGYLGREVTQAVITAPALQYTKKLQAIIKAGEAAGLTIVGILNKPSAAALAYDNKKGDNKKTFVFDLGAKTLVTTIIHMQAGVPSVIASREEHNVGWVDFKKSLSKFCLQQFSKRNGITLTMEELSGRERNRLYTECEKQIRNLYHTTQVLVSVDSFHDAEDLVVRVMQAEFNEINDSAFRKFKSLITKTLADANLTAENIDDVILIGGSTKLPRIQELVERHLRAPLPRMSEAVAVGAALVGVESGSQINHLLDAGVLFCPLAIPKQTKVATSERFSALADLPTTVVYETLMRRYISEEKDKLKKWADIHKWHRLASQKSMEFAETLSTLNNSGAQTKNGRVPLSSLRAFIQEEGISVDNSGPVIGFDFGTSSCCVALYRDDEVEVIQNDFGMETTPSFVSFDEDGECVVGEVARNQSHESPETTFYDLKRMLGRSVTDQTVTKFQRIWPFKLQEYREKILLQAPGKLSSPVEVIAEIIKYLKRCAEDSIGEDVFAAVVTVPVYFDSKQKQQLLKAFKRANLEILEVVSEPVAAALSYWDHLRGQAVDHQHQFIFDLGGGTFDVAVSEMKKGKIFIKAVDGDPNLGGNDFDEEMVIHCVQSFRRETGIDLLNPSGATGSDVARRLQRLKKECEAAKRFLSSTKEFTVSMGAMYKDQDLTCKFTQELFSSLVSKYLISCREVIDRILSKVKLQHSDFSCVILVGGSSRIPSVREMLRQKFPGSRLLFTINPDHAVACGAALLAHLKKSFQDDACFYEI